MSCATLTNTRGNNCPTAMDIAKRLIFVPELGSAGAKNQLAIADIDKATLQAKFDQANDQDRYYPISALENVEDLRAEPTYFEFNSGVKSKTKEGTRTFTGFIPFQGAEYLAKLEKWECANFGIYIIDKAGNFIYSKDGANAQPILIAKDSFSAEYIKKTETEPAMIKIMFDFREGEKDSDLRLVEAKDLDFDGLSEVDVYGLFDASIASVAGGAGESILTITEADYGFAIEGLVAGDLTLSAGVVTSLTETAEGVYTLVTTATSGDTVKINKSGYDSTATALVVG
jgi:hypothetical protein